jgi:hypothetical protein
MSGVMENLVRGFVADSLGFPLSYEAPVLLSLNGTADE